MEKSEMSSIVKKPLRSGIFSKSLFMEEYILNGRNRSTPTIFRIIQSDYAALLAALFPVMCWGLYLALMVFGALPGRHGRGTITAAEGGPFFLGLAIVALVIGLPLLIWRIRFVQNVFARGVEVEGKIVDVSFYRDRGRVRYAYEYQGRTYERGNAVSGNKRTRALAPGAKVAVAVDPLRPKRAFIRDLYLGEV